MIAAAGAVGALAAQRIRERGDPPLAPMTRAEMMILLTEAGVMVLAVAIVIAVCLAA
ncbi:hypothetical protein CcrC1_gp483 [Caulobacter phage C1]|nr:hypothetical protein CcrC1_gp483 [Caulobacter phage C1]UTU08696.1 hypothetical protein CcrC2_gp469 [Caulobacter phage C2]UTU09228.1 hypothetical protein CcrJ4_gp481 [Caulobacter phage J4]WGN97358.1 hypothetical protein [Bertelyvirus sp.]WGN97896.1 hypothetical protein [Bertelyvirus sp.]